HLMQAHAEGRRVVLIVDEAQTLSPELLEQVRLLTNLETSKQKLLQIILIGQPELRELLDGLQMRQIAQRITGRYHLEPLRKDETRAYVSHRLRVAGTQNDIFTKRAISALYRHARGIPRLINVIADRALLAAYTKDQRSIDAKLVSAAASEVFGVRRKAPWWPFATGAAGAAAIVLGVTNLGNAPAVPEPAAQQFLGAPASPPAPAPTAALAVDAAGTRPPSEPSALPPPEESPTLAKLIEDPKFALTTDAAIAELLAVWGAPYDPARGEPCIQAQERGLRCLYQRRGTLSELRRVNWPAILLLVAADGTEQPVVVTALGYDHAQLVANGSTFKLPLAELSYYWFGDHLLLWRPGKAPAHELAPGVDEEGVRWLRETLALLAGESVGIESSTLYDTVLEQRVRAYQRAHQLTVDGIVGARTQIAMLAELNLPDTPSLVKDH
ncbi:MAG TPA: AAA family ATPase, partial [Gammaproteobacteria bacterium]|nr:AAA family ATPase [Gammaproteobacteria bacterium]